MPKSPRMPKLEEIPIHAPEADRAGRHGDVGWFLRGFAAAAVIFAAYLVFGGHFGSAVASHDDARTIIVGK